jgi:hypothetical protein
VSKQNNKKPQNNSKQNNKNPQHAFNSIHKTALQKPNTTNNKVSVHHNRRRRSLLTNNLHSRKVNRLSNRWITDYQTRLKNRLASVMRMRNKDNQLYRRNYDVLEKVEIFA